MAVLVPAFPAPFPDNVKSIRFYATGTLSGDFDDNKFVFVRVNPVTPGVNEQAWSEAIRVRAVGADVEISFDGVNIHGFVPADTVSEYFRRIEGGIAIRGGAGTFHIEAW